MSGLLDCLYRVIWSAAHYPVAHSISDLWFLCACLNVGNLFSFLFFSNLVGITMYFSIRDNLVILDLYHKEQLFLFEWNTEMNSLYCSILY